MLNPRVVDEILDMMMEISGLVVLSLRLVRLIFALVVLNPRVVDDIIAVLKVDF